jgi:hypothetical protein
MFRRLLPLVVLVAALVPDPVAAQGRVTEAEARAALLVAAAEKDPKRFRDAYQRAIRRHAPHFNADPHVLIRTAAYAVVLEGPAQRLGRAAAENVRRMEPIAPVPWLNGVAVVVEPWMAGGDDIGKVVVMREGKVVEPLSSTLAPAPFVNAMGATFRLHVGEVVFPAEAFALGSPFVDVILIPATGDNIRRRLTDRATLRTIQ